MSQPIEAIVADLRKDLWAMEPKRLDALFTSLAVRPDASRNEVSAGISRTAQPKTPRMTVANGLAVIPVHGVLMKSGSWVLDYLDIEYTTYANIRAALAAALADDTVQSILLHVDSPGGQVAGVQEAADALYAARTRKPLAAYIEDLGASGAYHLASQAEFISANKNAEVGSIGVYEVLVDSAKAAENNKSFPFDPYFISDDRANRFPCILHQYFFRNAETIDCGPVHGPHFKDVTYFHFRRLFLRLKLHEICSRLSSKHV